MDLLGCNWEKKSMVVFAKKNGGFFSHCTGASMIPEIGFASQSVSGRDRFPPRTEVTEALPTSLRSIKKATNVDMCELSSYPLFRWWTTTWLDVKWCENSRGEFAKMNKVVEPSCRGIECCPEHVHVCICCIYILVCAKSGTTISYYF